jgi:exodeoxyribonuclease V alpha subunit
MAALGGFRLLCAHRHGRYGVAAWSAQVERWLADRIEGFVPGEPDRPGRPLLVTRNDYELRLYNGDTGVVVGDGDGRPVAMFERDGVLARFAPSRLEAVEALYAMTIHKSQGSQFDAAAVLLPDPSSRLLSRELLYTAITRARRRLLLVCTEESLRAAVERPVARATGLRERLWGSP